MTTPARSFQLAKPRAKNQDDAQYPPITYVFTETEPDEGWPVDEETQEPIVVERTVVAHFPGEGVFSILVAMSGMAETDGQAIAGTVFSTLKKSFTDRGDYAFLRAKLETEELQLEQMMELIEDMIEQWSAFPTKPASASTPSPARTGGRSTGRVSARASTPQS